jgi:ArsR family transcriptional regulator
MADKTVDTATRLEDKFDEAAKLFKALAHPLRLKLVCGLIRQPNTQTVIAKILDMPQSSLAQHIAVLRREGIVEGKRERGAEVILEVVDSRIPRLFREVCGGDDFMKYGWKPGDEISHSCIQE